MPRLRLPHSAGQIRSRLPISASDLSTGIPNQERDAGAGWRRRAYVAGTRRSDTRRSKKYDQASGLSAQDLADRTPRGLPLARQQISAPPPKQYAGDFGTE